MFKDVQMSSVATGGQKKLGRTISTDGSSVGKLPPCSLSPDTLVSQIVGHTVGHTQYNTILILKK